MPVNLPQHFPVGKKPGDVIQLTRDLAEWRASLAITLAKTPRGARVIHSSHQGPLYIQKPFYPEGASLAHIYLLHPPGGLVTGDTLHIDLTIESGCGGLFTTPGAARVYRARSGSGVQLQNVGLKIAGGGSGEWFPLENIIYPGARGKLITRIELESGAVFSGWEITCLGLPASGQSFDSGKLQQRFEIYRDGRLSILESLVLDASNSGFLQGGAGLRGNSVNGLFVSGPFADESLLGNLLEKLQELSSPREPLLATTRMENFLVTRYLGNCAQQARNLFVQCWELVRPVLLARQACLPRIWST